VEAGRAAEERLAADTGLPAGVVLDRIGVGLADTEAGSAPSALVSAGAAGTSGEEDDGLTAAERAHAKFKEASDARIVAKSAGSSHRDRVEEFNSKLANEPMHYDLFRIAAAGLG